MKRRVNRWLSLTLSLLFLLALFPAGAGADGGQEIANHQSAKSTDIPYAVTGGNIFFDAETGTVVSSDESVTEVDIPQEINGIKVTAIGDYSFGGTSITKITIPEGVVSIGKQVFQLCTKLTSVTIPEGVTTIGDGAFGSCRSLTGVTIPEGVTTIGDGAFGSCRSLTGVTIPESVTTIGVQAFYGCYNLTNVSIPKGVTSIGYDTFYLCSSLTDVTIPEGVTSIGSYAFGCCSSLTGVKIPEGMTTIGDGAFRYCDSLTDVTIPESVTTIGRSAFDDCDSLTDVYYGGSEANWAVIEIEEDNNPLLNAAIHCSSTIREATDPAEESAPDVPAEAPVVSSPVVQVSNQKLAVDGVAVEIDHYNIDGSNYFKLRDLACILKGTSNAFDVGYDSASRTVTLTTGGVYTPLDTDMQLGTDQSATAVVSNQRITVNGEEAALTAYNIGGSNFFMLRDLAPYLGFDVDYDSATRTALILTK